MVNKNIRKAAGVVDPEHVLILKILPAFFKGLCAKRADTLKFTWYIVS